MVPVSKDASAKAEPAMESIAYIRQMLSELRGVADEQGADMLCYLVEMAYVEAGDILAGRRALSFSDRKGEPSAAAVTAASAKGRF